MLKSPAMNKLIFTDLSMALTYMLINKTVAKAESKKAELKAMCSEKANNKV